MAFNYPIGKGGAPAKKMAKSPVSEPDEMQGEEPEDGAAIAEEHGPATEVHIQHEHEMGAHHVTSEHPDGYHYESDNESAAATHDHAKKLASHAEPDGDKAY